MPKPGVIQGTNKIDFFSVSGTSGNDEMNLKSGNDAVHGTYGDDIIDLGAGDDWVDYSFLGLDGTIGDYEFTIIGNGKYGGATQVDVYGTDGALLFTDILIDAEAITGPSGTYYEWDDATETWLVPGGGGGENPAPVPSVSIDFNSWSLDGLYTLALSADMYLQDGYRIAQLTDPASGSAGFESVLVAGETVNFDDGDGMDVDDFIGGDGGDFEFKIWTEADGTTHELNVSGADTTQIDIMTIELAGLDAGETATILLADNRGNVVEQYDVTDVGGDGVESVSIDYAGPYQQVSIYAATNDTTFYVDSIDFA